MTLLFNRHDLRGKGDAMYRILELNPQLEPFSGDIDLRMHLYRSAKKRILPEGQSLNDFANAHMYFGFHHVDGGWYYREWAPSAYQLYLEGEFNGWNQTSHPLTNLGNGNWELYLPGDDALWDGCKVKTVVDTNLTRTEHIPLYARRVVQNKQNITFECEVVDDRKAFPWTDKGFTGEDELYIYEAHIGMAQEEGKVGSYREFADNILPRIHKAGYNTLQLMAIMEHPYYGSFGYQVSSFFAASSWFGKPEDLKYLVNKAHAMGIRVLLDVVHSHAVKNTAEGINMFDGTTWQFFHDGPKGDHPAWGTKCFDYGKTGVIHFLLSNLKFWMTEYHFDGFRFDGVTSMLYHDHALGTDFTSDGKYFSYNTDTEAVTYLQLANELIRQVNPKAITIAEDMSGMPGMCLPIADGGIGFDYRLGMGLPDMWIKAVKGQDEFWDINQMWGSMCLRRPGEKTVGLCGVPRSGAGGRPDDDLPPGRGEHVHRHEQGLPQPRDRPRHCPAQDDSSVHSVRRRRSVPQLYGQRIRPSRMDRLPPGGQRLELPLLPPPVEPEGQRNAQIPVAGRL